MTLLQVTCRLLPLVHKKNKLDSVYYSRVQQIQTALKQRPSHLFIGSILYSADISDATVSPLFQTKWSHCSLLSNTTLIAFTLRLNQKIQVQVTALRLRLTHFICWVYCDWSQGTPTIKSWLDSIDKLHWKKNNNL